MTLSRGLSFQDDSDASVVARVLAGDSRAYAILVARYRAQFARYAVRMLGTREDAEEALQDAFVRGYRSIAFTPEGERLFRVADASVQHLQDVLGVLTASRDRMPVTITASIGVTALWLLPRLTRLQQQFPDIDVRVAANNKVLDLRTEGVDLAIRYCSRSAAPPISRRRPGRR